MNEHPATAAALDAWWSVAKAARRRQLAECGKSFGAADPAGRCLIFDIPGNRFRLITVVSWRNRRVYVKTPLTHREYERNTWHKRAY